MTSIENVLIVGGGIGGTHRRDRTVACRGVVRRRRHRRSARGGGDHAARNRAVDGLAEIGVLDRFTTEGLPVTPQRDLRLLRRSGAAGSDAAHAAAPAVAAAGRHPRVPADRWPRSSEKLRSRPAPPCGSASVWPGWSSRRTTVTATLTDGSAQSYDLVVGADGVRSTTRSLIMGDEVVPTYSGVTMFRWVVDGVPDVGPLGFYESEYLNVTLRLRDGRIYLATGRGYPERPRLTADEARQIVRENLLSFTAPLQRAIEERLTDDARIIVNDYDWLIAPDPWYSGRVLLIGDAAHATTAHLASGGAMAIEDGVVLGQEVAAGGPVEDVLKRFMARRFERSRLVVETSVELDRMQRRGEPIAAQNQVRGRAMGRPREPVLSRDDGQETSRMSDQMRAYALREFGEPPGLTEVPVPEAGPGEVRVRVTASSVNPYDAAAGAGFFRRMSEYRLPAVLGRDVAGTVDQVGAGVTAFAPGDEVLGMVKRDYVGDGTFAEYVVVPEDRFLVHRPEALGLAEAGALGLAAVTALQSLRELGLRPEDTVLVNGATGGVGAFVGPVGCCRGSAGDRDGTAG